jgi:hypothetical protein
VCSMNDQLIRAEARELHRHRAAGGSNEYVQARAAILDRLYGLGAKDAVREYMKQIKEGNSE